MLDHARPIHRMVLERFSQAIGNQEVEIKDKTIQLHKFENLMDDCLYI